MPKSWFFSGLFLFALAGCLPSSTKPDAPFQVRVLDSSGNPIVGVTVESPDDTGDLSVQTDASGRAEIPGKDWRQAAILFKDGYLASFITPLGARDYYLRRAPKSLLPLGEVAGDPVWFRDGVLATVEYSGTYHLYRYDESSLTEVSQAALAPQARRFVTEGDTLWAGTFDGGIYAYSLSDLANPRQILHLPIPDIIGPLAVRGSILAVGDEFDSGPLRIFRFSADGSATELARLAQFQARALQFRSRFLVLLGLNESQPVIFDLTDPSSPRFVYNVQLRGYRAGFFYGDGLVLQPDWGQGDGTVTHKWVSLALPTQPMEGSIPSDSRLLAMADDSTAVGSWYFDRRYLTVTRKDMSGYFRGIAQVRTEALFYPTACAPPFFVMAGRLWRLGDSAGI